MVPRNYDVKMTTSLETPNLDMIAMPTTTVREVLLDGMSASSTSLYATGEACSNGNDAADNRPIDHQSADHQTAEHGSAGSENTAASDVPSDPDSVESTAGDAGEELEPEEPQEDQIIKLAAQIFAQAGAYSVLNPGCGNGHCARFLARAGFTVTAFDLPSRAVHVARNRQDMPTMSLHYHIDDPSLPTRQMGLFDGLFAPNLLHSMTRISRQRVLRLLSKYVRPGGVALFSVLSERDPRYGMGREVESGTFEVVPGQVVHFYNDEEVIFELEGHFKVSFMELVTDVEVDHQGNRREYAMILVGGTKRPT